MANVKVYLVVTNTFHSALHETSIQITLTTHKALHFKIDNKLSVHFNRVSQCKQYQKVRYTYVLVY